MTKATTRHSNKIDLEYETIEDAIIMLERFKGLGATLGEHDHGMTPVSWEVEETDEEYKERLNRETRQKAWREEQKQKERRALYIRLHEEFGNDK